MSFTFQMVIYMSVLTPETWRLDWFFAILWVFTIKAKFLDRRNWSIAHGFIIFSTILQLSFLSFFPFAALLLINCFCKIQQMKRILETMKIQAVNFFKNLHGFCDRMLLQASLGMFICWLSPSVKKNLASIVSNSFWKIKEKKIPLIPINPSFAC